MSKAKKYHRIAVLMGGPSSEREISLKSGAAISAGLKQSGYDVVGVDIETRDFVLPDSTEAVFIALHGAFGEDGQVQSMLQEKGIPYVGAGPEGSKAAFDKGITKERLVTAGIPTAAYQLLHRGDQPTLELPAVVKPTCQGSTIGIHKVTRAEEWEAALDDAFSYGDELLVEDYIDGRELTVGVVGEEALPVVEVLVPGGWYDFGAKYSSSQTSYLVPAPIEDGLAVRCRELALATFEILECRGLGRIDFRLGLDLVPYVLELNTIPGFTETSLLPKAAKAVGIDFPELCDRIISMATL